MARWLLVLALIWPVAAGAQDDAMEVQRCVWRCLADSPGVESAEYGQCVAAKCNGPSEAAPASGNGTAAAPPSGPPWSQGRTQDAQGHYAGQFAPETGNYFYYTCDAGGTQNLLLSGAVEGPSAVLTLDIDGQVLGVWFERSDGGFTARLDPGSPVPGLLTGARRVDLRNEAGWSLGPFGMAGAEVAIGGTRAACGL